MGEEEHEKHKQEEAGDSHWLRTAREIDTNFVGKAMTHHTANFQAFAAYADLLAVRYGVHRKVDGLRVGCRSVRKAL